MIKVVIKFNVNKTLNMDYKPYIEIRNIRKLHTCKNLDLNVLYLFKNYYTCTHFQNSSVKLRETDFDRQIKVITFLGETPRHFIEKHRGILSTWLISRCFSEK